jgi:hypothetical protein
MLYLYHVLAMVYEVPGRLEIYTSDVERVGVGGGGKR